MHHVKITAEVSFKDLKFVLYQWMEVYKEESHNTQSIRLWTYPT